MPLHIHFPFVGIEFYVIFKFIAKCPQVRQSHCLKEVGKISLAFSIGTSDWSLLQQEFKLNTLTSIEHFRNLLNNRSLPVCN